MNPKQKIAFFGSDEIALPCLHALTDSSLNWQICGVLTQPDRRSGRGRSLRPNPIKNWAIQSNIPVMDPVKPGVEEAKWIRSLGAELVLVMAYGHILNNELLDVASSGCFNLHASILPKYRGASPIETAIAMGEEKTGVTLMEVIPRMDAGPVIDSEIVVIDEDDTGPQLRSKIADACYPLLSRNLSSLLSGDYKKNQQNEEEATYCRKLTKSDGCLDFNLTAEELACRSRAFSDWPGSFFLHEGSILRVGKMVRVSNYQKLKPGERRGGNQKSLIIGTGEGAVEILELQRPGAKMLPIQDFLRGYSLPNEIIFSSSRDQQELIRC